MERSYDERVLNTRHTYIYTTASEESTSVPTSVSFLISWQFKCTSVVFICGYVAAFETVERSFSWLISDMVNFLHIRVSDSESVRQWGACTYIEFFLCRIFLTAPISDELFPLDRYPLISLMYSHTISGTIFCRQFNPLTALSMSSNCRDNRSLSGPDCLYTLHLVHQQVKTTTQTKEDHSFTW